MLPEQWQRLRAAYDAVMDAPEAERRRLLDDVSGSDPELGRELARLVAADPDGAAFLETPLVRLGPPRFQAGTILSNRFVLQRLLGQGGMGEVWAARDQSLDADVAIKMVRVGGDGRQDLRRFTNEIQLARRISHPNVCRVYEFFEDSSVTPPRAYLTMELLEGETVAARLQRSGPMPADEALAVFRQMARGLEAAHEAGVIHRDLKPANIMLVAGSSSRQAVVMDFGLARDHVRFESDGTTTPGTLVGTPEYMAPEQVSGGTVTPATDIYALGLILFEMLRGTRPFASSSTLDSWMRRAREGPEKLSGAVLGVQARVDGVIRRCLEYDASRRPQSVTELLHALDSAFYVPVPKSRRFWVPAAGVTVVALAVAGAAAWAHLSPQLPPPETLRWYDDARQALSEGAAVRALNSVQRVIGQAPRFAPAYAALAEIRLELEMPGAAQEAMLRANELVRDTATQADEHARYMDGIQALLTRQCDAAIAALGAAAAATPSPRRSYAMVTHARAMERCDRPQDGLAVLKEASLLDSLNPAAPLRGARLAARGRDYAGAMALLDTADRLFRDRNNIEGLGEVLTLRGTLLVEQDRLVAADEALARAAAMASSLEDVRQQVRVMLQQAIVQRKRNDVAAAGRLTATAIDMGRRANLESTTLEGLVAAGNLHLIRNEFVEATEVYQRALDIAETYRHEEIKARVHLNMASLHVQTLHPDKAVEEIDAARPYYERVNHTRNVALLDALSGQVRLALMDYEAAITQFETAAARAERAGDREQETVARENLATALAGAGRYADALAMYTRVRTAHERAGRARGATFATLNQADLLSRLGRFDEANAAIAAVPGDLPEEMRAQKARIESAVMLRRGDMRAAAALARLALRLGAGRSPERLRRAEMVLCEATVRSGAADQQPCLDLETNTNGIGHLAIRLQSLLVLAEAGRAKGRDVEPLLQQAGAMLARLGENEHRSRYLAMVARGP